MNLTKQPTSVQLPIKNDKIVKYSKKIQCGAHMNGYFAGLRRYLLNQITYYKISKVTYDRLKLPNFAALNLILSLIPFEKAGTVRIKKNGGIITTADLIGIKTVAAPLQIYDLEEYSVNISCQVTPCKPIENAACQNIAAMTIYREGAQTTIRIESDSTIDYEKIFKDSHKMLAQELIKVSKIILANEKITEIDLKQIISETPEGLKKYITDIIISILRRKNLIPKLKNQILKPIIGTKHIDITDLKGAVAELTNLQL